MKKVTWIDRGYDELIILNGESHRSNNLTSRQILELLERHDFIELEAVNFDEHEKSNKE